MQQPEAAPAIIRPPRISVALTVLGLQSEETTKKFVNEILQRAIGAIASPLGEKKCTLQVGDRLVDFTLKQQDLKNYAIHEDSDNPDPDKKRVVVNKSSNKPLNSTNFIVIQNFDEESYNTLLFDFVAALPGIKKYLVGQADTVQTLKQSPESLHLAGVVKDNPQILQADNTNGIDAILKEIVIIQRKEMIGVGNSIINVHTRKNGNAKEIDFSREPDFPELIYMVASALAVRDNSDVAVLNCANALLSETRPRFYKSPDPVGDLCYALVEGNFANLKELNLGKNQLNHANVTRILQALVKVVHAKSLRELILNKNDLENNTGSLLALLQSGICDDGLILSLKATGMSGQGIITLLDGLTHPNCPKGITLDLSGNQLSIEATEELLARLQGNNIGQVTLANNSIDDPKVAAITMLINRHYYEPGLVLNLGDVAVSVDTITNALMSKTDIFVNVAKPSKQLQLLNERNQLIARYPEYESIIKRSCHPGLYRADATQAPSTPLSLKFLAAKEVLSSHKDAVEGLPQDIQDFINNIKTFETDLQKIVPKP